MPEKSGRPLILIACACAVFWPGAFIFGFPGVMSQHWRIAFQVNDSEVGRTIFFILIGATCFMYPGLFLSWPDVFCFSRVDSTGATLAGMSVVTMNYSPIRSSLNDT